MREIGLNSVKLIKEEDFVGYMVFDELGQIPVFPVVASAFYFRSEILPRLSLQLSTDD